MMFQESFFVFKTTMNNVFLPNIFIKCAPFIFKMGEDLMLMIKKEIFFGVKFI
jgi:hypothetical protein